MDGVTITLLVLVACMICAWAFHTSVRIDELEKEKDAMLKNSIDQERRIRSLLDHSKAMSNLVDALYNAVIGGK